jgi:phospholipase C
MKKSILPLGVTAALLSGAAFAQEDQIPQLDHVFVIVMENHAYDQIIGNNNAPFVNQLARFANLATNYFAVGHPSLPNYLEIVGGSNFGVTSDNNPDWHYATRSPNLVEPIPAAGTDAATPAAMAPFNTDIPAAPFVGQTIAHQLVAANKSWKSYQESLPASGADRVNYSDGDFSNLSAVNQGSVQKLYAVKHNPFVYFANVQAGTDPRIGLNNVVGFDGLDGLYADLSSGKVPNFSFIAPNQCHDMHGTGGGSAFCTSDPTLIKMGDAEVQKLVTAIKDSNVWQRGKNAIVVLWDENDFGTDPNRVVAIVDTNYGVHGVTSTRPYSHFSLLKTLEAGFRLPCLNHACDADVNVMSDLFAAPRPR